METWNKIKSKALERLEQWCVTYKLIGSPDETPRYSQLMRSGETFVLKSTQKELYYELDLTEAENRFLMGADPRKLWELWKETRTEYLSKNHPTINR